MTVLYHLILAFWGGGGIGQGRLKCLPKIYYDFYFFKIKIKLENKVIVQNRPPKPQVLSWSSQVNFVFTFDQ